MNPNIDEKAILPNGVLDRSVQSPPDYQTIPGGDTFVINISSFADDLPAWGRQVRQRDLKLREFWPTEPIIAGAIQTVVSTRANMSWSLDGPPRTVGIMQRMLQASNLGKGWLDLQIKVATDLLSQDNGAFVEIVRQDDKPNSPVLNLAHLDAGRCIRTGMPEIPVIYYDREGVEHKLKWYQVLDFTDMPSPIEEMNGLQVCFLSRILRAAQIIKDFGIYKREKIAGRNPGEIHLVSGVQTKLIEDKLRDNQHTADNQGYTRFMLPAVIGSLDPNATVSATTISLRDVPDGFDEDTTLRWYIAQIAMAAGADYQEFAPLPSNNLGSSTQSEVLARKGRGKGQETWRKLWEHKLNFNGIMPQSVTFSFDQKDVQEDIETAELNDKKAKTYSTYYDKGQGVLPLNVIHQMMADDGILKPEYLAMMNTDDVTDDIVADDSERAPTESELEDAQNTPSADIAESQPEEVPLEQRSKDSKNDINYGCLMLMMPSHIKEQALYIASQIDHNDLHEIGIEDETHVTVKYGFNEGVTPGQITQTIQGLLPVTIQIGDLSLFENDEFDVLKLNIESAKLRRMNEAVSELDVIEGRPNYTPHMTIAYLKSGTGRSYLGLNNPLKGISTRGELVYSDKDKNKSPIQGIKNRGFLSDSLSFLGNLDNFNLDIAEGLNHKQIDTSEYDDFIAEMMRLVGNGSINKNQFIDELNGFVSEEIMNAFLEGSGKTVAQLSQAELAIIEQAIQTNLESIPGLADSVTEWVDGDSENINKLIRNRVILWGKNIEGVYNQGFLRGGDDDEALAWRLGPADHCINCATLANLVMTRREWRNSGWFPQSPRLACGGWRCGCSFQSTDEPLTGGAV